MASDSTHSHSVTTNKVFVSADVKNDVFCAKIQAYLFEFSVVCMCAGVIQCVSTFRSVARMTLGLDLN